MQATKQKKAKSKVGHTQKKQVVHVSFDCATWQRVKESAAAKGLTAAAFVRFASLEAAEK